jgi:glycosyltransferase involved in cell wall biosynthesis
VGPVAVLPIPGVRPGHGGTPAARTPPGKQLAMARRLATSPRFASAASPARPQVVIDVEKLRRENCGLGRFCRHLAEGILASRDRAFDPVFLLPRQATPPRHEGCIAQIDVRPWRKESFARFYRPLVPAFARGRYDLWHVTNQTSKYLPLDPAVPVVLTIHDLNFLHDERRQAARSERKLADVQRKVDRAAAVVTDTRYVADDVARHLRLDGKPVHVIPLGMPAPSKAAAHRPARVPAGPFFLAIGNALPHKNFHVLLDLMAGLPRATLVVAGNHATPYGQRLVESVAARGLEGRVILTGEVSDADRQWLYEQCDAVFVPSLTEGFGLPVLEAMQCGKPVFLSRRTCLPEIGGELAFYWDHFEPTHMREVVESGLRNAAADAGFGDRLRAHAARFSWDRAVREYLAVYDAVLAAA